MKLFFKLLLPLFLAFAPLGASDDFDEEFQEKKVYDPLESYNRSMSKFNDDFYEFAIKNILEGYVEVTPHSFRVSVSNFFHNILTPIYLVNNLLQLDFKKFETDTVRFLVNTTAGMGGIFDVAGEELELYSSREDLGQTLGYWGVPSGFYFVLPILGPTNARDLIGMVGDGYANPVSYIDSIEAAIAINAYRQLNTLSFYMDQIEMLKKDTIDPYTYTRDFYEANRRSRIME